MISSGQFCSIHLLTSISHRGCGELAMLIRYSIYRCLPPKCCRSQSQNGRRSSCFSTFLISLGIIPVLAQPLCRSSLTWVHVCHRTCLTWTPFLPFPCTGKICRNQERLVCKTPVEDGSRGLLNHPHVCLCVPWLG